MPFLNHTLPPNLHLNPPPPLPLRVYALLGLQVRTLPNAFNKAEECYSADMATYRNCKEMVTLVVGSPGCREQISTGGPSAAITAVKILNYGYGHLRCASTSLGATPFPALLIRSPSASVPAPQRL